MKKDNNIKTLIKALKISIKTSSTFSLIISVLGFGMAFIPSLIATTLKNLTNSIQNLMVGTILPIETLKIFLVFVGIYLIQIVYQFFQNLTQRVDSNITIYNYIKKSILKTKCEVKYKYIENYDDFNNKISFIETRAGRQVAASFQKIISLIQNIITFASITYLLYKVNPFIVVAVLKGKTINIYSISE